MSRLPPRARLYIPPSTRRPTSFSSAPGCTSRAESARPETHTSSTPTASQIIADPADVAVGIESGTETLGGSYATGKIDVKDLETMAGGTGVTDVGSLIHELVEQYHKQVKKTEYGGEATGAHHEAIKAENAVNGTIRGPQKVVSATQHADGTLDAVVEVPYTYPDGKVVTTTLTITKNNIIKSEDKVTTPGKTK